MSTTANITIESITVSTTESTTVSTTENTTVPTTESTTVSTTYPSRMYIHQLHLFSRTKYWIRSLERKRNKRFQLLLCCVSWAVKSFDLFMQTTICNWFKKSVKQAVLISSKYFHWYFIYVLYQKNMLFLKLWKTLHLLLDTWTFPVFIIRQMEIQ